MVSSDMYQWIGKLGAVTQFRGVDYVVMIGNGQVQCKLCGTGGMYKSSRMSHFLGSGHAMMYNDIQKLELKLNRLDKVLQSEARVRKLGSIHWQRHVKSLMFEYTSQGVVPIGEWSQFLTKYERMERTSLLELAIWKARICDGLFFQSLEQVHEYKLLDSSFDEVAYRKNLRFLSGAEVIIPLVVEFLGPMHVAA